VILSFQEPAEDLCAKRVLLSVVSLAPGEARSAQVGAGLRVCAVDPLGAEANEEDDRLGSDQVRALEDLLSDEPAWPLVESWLAQSTNDAVALPATREYGESVLLELQVSSRSMLGAVALETGGILIDHGWVRLLGSGSPRLLSTLASWNNVGPEPEIDSLEHALVVGFDAISGFFAINGGQFKGERGHVFYFAPDALEWQSLDRGYTDFGSGR
jgi:hypothetical protein